MTFTITEQKAKALAEQYGRDWKDMGEHEREAYRGAVRASEQEGFHCPFCGEQLPDERSAHCGEVGHAQSNQLT